MRNFIGAAATAALVMCLVPQSAFGIAKPLVSGHPDIAPVDTISVSGSATRSPSYSIQGSLSGGGVSGGTNLISFASLSTGDMVVVFDPTSLTGHAGLFDRSRYYSVTSYAVVSANVVPVSGVQIEKCAKYRLYDSAYALRVPQEYAHRNAVRDYALRQLGKPYSLVATKTDTRSFYCSKLAWAAYRSVTGVDLDADGGIWVWPVDLLNSRYTSVVGHWS